MKLPRIILASASPRREALLRQLTLDFLVSPTVVQECDHAYLTPREICLLNAYHKARAGARQWPDELVLGADTVVCLGHELFGKPASLAEARFTLARLQGRTHEVITGVCLFWARHPRARLFAETTQVTFKQLSPAQIRAYLNKVNALDKAGAYGIQEHGEMIIQSISGSYSNVVGLPLERLRRELRHFARRNSRPGGM